MKKSRRICLISLIFSLAVFTGFAEGQQENGAPGRPPQNDEQSRGPEITRPSDSELTLMKLQLFAEDAETEPSLLLSVEQAQLILPIIEDWNETIKADKNADSAVFIDGINKILTAEQNSFLPMPPAPEGKTDGERPERGERPEAPKRPSTTEMIAELIETLAELI